METLKNVMYAGIGSAHHTEDKMKEKFNVLVEKGKEVDAEGKNIVGDLLKTLDELKEYYANLLIIQYHFFGLFLYLSQVLLLKHQV